MADPLAPVVDARYRLRAADLQNRTARLRIHNVTMQGVEAVRPVLHFAGERPLVVDSAQCNDLARITGSAVPAEWIGQEIVLVPVTEDNSTTLLILGPDEPHPTPKPTQATDKRSALPPAPRIEISIRTLVIALLLFALLLLIYELTRNLDWRQIQQLIELQF